MTDSIDAPETQIADLRGALSLPVRYTPTDWYWLASDGRLFGSARAGTLAPSDPVYLAWQAGGRTPTPWPRDATGTQTDAALQEVLTPYGIFVDLAAYAASARYVKETGGITVDGVSVATDDRSKIMVMGARIAAEADANFTTPFVQSNGASITLTAAQVIAVSNALLEHVQVCFVTFNTVVAEVTASPPTITTTAEIDAAFAAVTA